MPQGKPPFEKPTDQELRERYGLERTGERRPPRKGEKYLGHQGEIHEAAEDAIPKTTLDHYEILGRVQGS